MTDTPNTVTELIRMNEKEAAIQDVVNAFWELDEPMTRKMRVLSFLWRNIYKVYTDRVTARIEAGKMLAADAAAITHYAGGMQAAGRLMLDSIEDMESYFERDEEEEEEEEL